MGIHLAHRDQCHAHTTGSQGRDNDTKEESKVADGLSTFYDESRNALKLDLDLARDKSPMTTCLKGIPAADGNILLRHAVIDFEPFCTRETRCPDERYPSTNAEPTHQCPAC